MVEHGKDLEDEFIHLQSKALGTMQRIDKNISLLTALVAIGEGKQQLEESHDIVRLSIFATVFLPFSTIAATLGMQGNYAPGSGVLIVLGRRSTTYHFSYGTVCFV